MTIRPPVGRLVHGPSVRGRTALLRLLSEDDVSRALVAVLAHEPDFGYRVGICQPMSEPERRRGTALPARLDGVERKYGPAE